MCQIYQRVVFTGRYSSLVSSMMVMAAGHDGEQEGAFQASGFDHMLERLRFEFPIIRAS